MTPKLAQHLGLLVAAGLLELLVLAMYPRGIEMLRGDLGVGVVGLLLLLVLGALMLPFGEFRHVLGRDEVGHAIGVVGDDGHG